MGASVSTCLLGLHTAIELGSGTVVFWTGNAGSADPAESKKNTGRDKMWKRWHASGLLALGYVGYLGLTKPELTSISCQLCGMFHSLATLSVILAYQDSTVDFIQAVPYNLHAYFALGFGAVVFGLLD
jgi:hypothetical protein